MWDALYGMPLTREQLEARRMAAARDLQRGMRQADVARKDGVGWASVCRWAKAFRGAWRRGRGSRPGRPEAVGGTARQAPRDADRRRRPPRLGHGPLDEMNRIAEFIRRAFGVRYNSNYVAELLHDVGFSWQEPRRRAREKAEDRRAGVAAHDVVSPFLTRLVGPVLPCASPCERYSRSTA